MESSELSARLRYLNDAAHLLLTTAPETSRHLMSCHDLVARENNIDIPDAHKRRNCGRCGTIMVLGWEATVQVEKQAPRRKINGRKHREHQGPRVVVYTCNSCGSKTRQALQAAPKIIRQRVVPLSANSSEHTSAKTNLSETLPAPSPSATPSAANANSKKRAKTRKNGSLEAILARQKAVDSRGSGFGLELMDFMKKK